MNTNRKILLFLLRISFGWLYFYAGITKIMNPEWSSAGYLKGAKTFAGMYSWFTSPGILPVVNFLNEWGLLLLGISLILGIGLRLTTVLGAALMVLYYFPGLTFPYIGNNSFLIDEHIIYALSLLLLGQLHAGRAWGLADWCARLPLCAKYPALRRLLA